jgi:hypothetical protein
MANVTGAAAHKRRLQRIRGPRMIAGVTRAIYGGAQDIQVDAQLSITNGATSGKNHVPSTAPDPPNNDSGVLAGNIEAVTKGPLKAETSSNAPYALPQEFGSEKLNLPERPYMRPAATKGRPKVRERVVKAVQRVTRGT